MRPESILQGEGLRSRNNIPVSRTWGSSAGPSFLFAVSVWEATVVVMAVAAGAWWLLPKADLPLYVDDYADDLPEEEWEPRLAVTDFVIRPNRRRRRRKRKERPSVAIGWLDPVGIARAGRVWPTVVKIVGARRRANDGVSICPVEWVSKGRWSCQDGARPRFIS